MEHDRQLQRLPPRRRGRVRTDAGLGPPRACMAHPAVPVSSWPATVADRSLGDAGFRHLFLSTSLFLPLGNNCYMQLSGAPLSEMGGPGPKRPAEGGGGDAKRARPNKKTL